ncbi:hypothetical protein JCM18899A_40180 [Nocardioides sp. AN3]
MPDTPDDEQVRRLLADARHDEPMPADVVARLEGVLDDLTAERREVTPLAGRRTSDPDPDSPEPNSPGALSSPGPLSSAADSALPGSARPAGHRSAARRSARSRRWAVALVAAAAVVVGGAVVRTLGPDHSGGSSSGSAASDSSAMKESGGQVAGPSAAAGVAELHRATLEADVRRATTALRSGLMSSAPPAVAGDAGCAPADWGPGEAVPARLDGVDVMLVLRPPSHGKQVADVLACGSAEVLASVTVPAG